jgi:Fanconi anemia group M protein
MVGVNAGMETQKTLSVEGKVVIVSDYREKEITKILKNFDSLVKTISLEVGDFVCSERVVIERKSYDDFVNSIINGRIFDQANALKENFEKPMILIEGNSDREINDNALKGAIASLLVDYGITLISTRNPLDTAKTIYWIAKKEQNDNKKCLSIKVGKKPKDTKKLQEFIVSSIPGVSRVLTKRLLEHFGNVQNVFAAEEEQLKQVDGIGDKMASKIKKLLSLKY